MMRVALDDADDEAGEVEGVRQVDIGHVRGLAADEGAAGVAAGRGQSLDNRHLLLLAEVALAM